VDRARDEFLSGAAFSGDQHVSIGRSNQLKGAFTGALKDKPGRFELAEGGYAIPR
jgi:hypothetical protein